MTDPVTPLSRPVASASDPAPSDAPPPGGAEPADPGDTTAASAETPAAPTPAPEEDTNPANRIARVPVDSDETATAPAPRRVDPARRPGVEAPVDAPGSLDSEVPQPAAPDAAARADLDPARAPEPAMDATPLGAPETASAPRPGVEVGTEAPVLPSPQALPPAAPAPETELAIATEPAQPPVPVVPEEESPLVDPEEEAAAPAPAEPEADAAAGTAEQAPQPEVADAPAQMTSPEVDTDMAQAPSEVVAPASPGPVPEPLEIPLETDRPSPQPAPERNAAPAPSAAPAPQPSAPIVRRLGTDTENAATGTDQAATGQADTGPAIGTPAGRLANLADNVAINRLPTLGGATEDTSNAAAAAPGVAPLTAFAAQVDVPDDKPRMAIVLIDDGSGPLGPEALEAFPFPLTFAVDSAAPGATRTMQGYRAQGFEVVALADVPQGARASDVEVTLEAALRAVPEAVAVLEGTGGGLQGARAISDQVTQVLAGTGHGLVFQPKGLNTAQALAAREGVPTGTVFRDFDSDGQDARVIRRFLDQAAFKARQEGAVIMLGRLRADTISALLLWGLQDRAESVALVPVSVVLREAAE